MHAVFEREDFQTKIGVFDFLSVNFNDQGPFKADFRYRYYIIDDKQCPVPTRGKPSTQAL